MSAPAYMDIFRTLHYTGYPPPLAHVLDYDKDNKQHIRY